MKRYLKKMIDKSGKCQDMDALIFVNLRAADIIQRLHNRAAGTFQNMVRTEPNFHNTDPRKTALRCFKNKHCLRNVIAHVTYKYLCLKLG